MTGLTRLMFVPTVVNATNHNAQVLNARAILAGWGVRDWRVAAHAYGEPDRRVATNPQITIARLWRRHARRLLYFFRYFQPCGLIFYPGITSMDRPSLRWRRRLGLSAPFVLVSTLGREGAEMARGWDWNVVAPKWRERLIEAPTSC